MRACAGFCSRAVHTIRCEYYIFTLPQESVPQSRRPALRGDLSGGAGGAAAAHRSAVRGQAEQIKPNEF